MISTSRVTLKEFPRLESIIRTLRWRPSIELSGFIKHEWPLIQESGSSFLSESEFASTIGRAIESTNAEQLVLVDLAPSVGTPPGDESCCLVTSTWPDFDAFQTSLIDDDTYLVDVGVLDRSATWILIKTPEVVCFLEDAKNAKKGGGAINPPR